MALAHIQYLLICNCVAPLRVPLRDFISPLRLSVNIYRTHLAHCQAAIYLRFLHVSHSLFPFPHSGSLFHFKIYTYFYLFSFPWRCAAFTIYVYFLHYRRVHLQSILLFTASASGDKNCICISNHSSSGGSNNNNGSLRR